MTRPSWVQEAAAAEFQEIVAALDAIAAGNTLDPAGSANFILQVASAAAISATSPAATSPVQGWQAAAAALYATIPTLVSGLTGIDPSLSAGILSLAQGLGSLMDPASASAAFGLAYDSTPTPSPAPIGATPNRIAANGNAIAAARFGRMAFLTAYVQALAAMTFADRPTAVTARADCVFRFDQELNLCSGAADADAADSLTKMENAIVAYLTTAIINSLPVLTVEAPPMPALVAAWALYQDPDQAADLIARNGVAVAEFMPDPFEALAPAA